MSRSHSLLGSFCALSLRTSYAPAAGPSTLRPFSTSQSTLISKRKVIAKKRKNANLALQASRIHKPESIDPVIGRVKFPGQEVEDLWQGCRLQRILLDYYQLAYSVPPDYASGERPRLFLPGLSEEDTTLLFSAVPHASLELRYASNYGLDGAEEQQAKQSEMMMRILDLRNASKDAINALNKKRVVDEFGGGKDTGSSSVQAALLTAKIYNLRAHIAENRRDLANKRNLRLLVQERARHLKYWKRSQGEESYDKLLADLGLERGAVEGELMIGF